MAKLKRNTTKKETCNLTEKQKQEKRIKNRSARIKSGRGNR